MSVRFNASARMAATGYPASGNVSWRGGLSAKVITGSPYQDRQTGPVSGPSLQTSSGGADWLLSGPLAPGLLPAQWTRRPPGCNQTDSHTLPLPHEDIRPAPRKSRTG